MHSSWILRKTLFAIFVLFLIGIPKAQATKEQANDSAEAIAVALKVLGYQFVTKDDGFLKPGGIIEIYATLETGKVYTIVAGGCDDAYDIDIAVFDENNYFIGKDTTTKPLAIVPHIAPRWTGMFKIIINMHRSTPDGAHYVVMIGSKKESSTAPRQPMPSPAPSKGQQPQGKFQYY
ncbi:MAG: hypothetical protein HY617_04115 [Candidatus Sungbacteria bacterium]|nr:hypothetical protein [Candidatus Sungbacteria bacterium]